MTKLPITVNLNAYHGDTWRQLFRFKRNDTPVDLNSVSIASQARRISTSSRIPLDISVETDPGLMTLSLPSDIDAGAYAYDIQIIESNGDVKTWVKGKLVIEKDETNVT
jgi:hypothetical protein